METTADEHRKIVLAPRVAQRVFSEQLYELACQTRINSHTKSKRLKIKLNDILEMHKNKYGYQIQWSNLGFAQMTDVINNLPYIEVYLIDLYFKVK